MKPAGYRTIMRLARHTLLLLAFAFPMLAKAQFYNGSQVTFGKNRVQYNDFLWTYFRFNNLDVYYYLNGRELAQHVADYASRYIPEIEKKLETTLDKKTQFIVYNTYADMKQSNIGLMNNTQYNTGGVTHIIGTKVFLYFDGDLNHFDRQIRAGIIRLLTENIIYGGSIGAQVKNSTLLSVPPWYIEGLVSYLSRNWDTELDNQLKDGIVSGRYRKFNHLTDQDAVIAGHSLWRYIAEKYGQDNLANIIYMTRVNRSVENGFLYVLGVSFKKIMNEWYAWYQDVYKTDNTGYTAFNPKAPLKIKKEKVYGNTRLSPDGQKMLYTVNEKGLYKVMLLDLSTGKQKRIFRKGFRTDEKVDYSYPLVAWHPSGQIAAMILQHKGLLYLYFYDFQTRKWESQNLFSFQKISDFSYSPDGRSFVMSAVQRGQSDIYTYNIAASSAQAITQDVYNDLYPRFLDRSNNIIFSSNRPDDTLRFTREITKSYDGLATNDLFIAKATPGGNLLQRVTNTRLANEIMPAQYTPGYFSYLSDANGVYNRYAGRYDSTVAYVDTTVHYRYFTQTFPLTNYGRSIESHDVSMMGGKTTEIVFENNKYNIYTGEIPQGKITPLAVMQPTPYMQQLETAYAKEKEEALKAAAQPKAAKVKRKRFVNVYTNEAGPAASDTSKVDISNYTISPGLAARGRTMNTAPVAEAAEGGLLKPPKPRNYNVEYSINELVSQLDFSYLNMSYQPYSGYAGPVYQNSPTNALLTVGATDLLEDFRIVGGVRLNSDLTNNEYLLGFANLKQRLDKEIYYHRTGYDISYTDAYVRHRINELHFVMRYPLSEVYALKGTLSLQNDKPTVLALDYATANLTGESNTWVVGKGELIYDNTREIGTNLLQGLRYKLFGEYYQLAKKSSTNMAVVGFDFRHYTKIHRSFIWANRLAGSTSFGQSQLLYYMGGVDNWLVPRFNSEYQASLSGNYAFQTLATNMRGFKQNARSGNTFALLSSELRLPVFRYFLNKPLKSDFLNNFQVVGFADVGSAWQGLNPLTEENTYYTKTVSQSPLNITVQVQKNPLIAGYGFGLRSSLFGYFLRADWAWGIEDKVVQPQIFYLSLSLDF